MAGQRMRLPPEVAEDSPDLEFWRSESWVQLWSGQPLQLPAVGSAAGLVRKALLPGSKVDFPQITEICDLVGGSFPQEGPEAIKLLVAAMRDKDAPFRKKLKALTITHEMLYDERAVLGFREMPGLQPALATLRSVKDSGLSEYVDENLRMLATEVDKVCFSESGGARSHGSRLRNFGSAVQKNLEAAAGKLRRDTPSPASPVNTGPVENTFYFDARHQRWRQHDVPDGLDDPPNQPAQATGNGLQVDSVPVASASNSGPGGPDPFRSGVSGNSVTSDSVAPAANLFASTSNSGPGGSDPFRSGVSGNSVTSDSVAPAANLFASTSNSGPRGSDPFRSGVSGNSVTSDRNNVTSDSVAPTANLFAGFPGSVIGGPVANGFPSGFDTDPNDFFNAGSGIADPALAAAFGPSEPKKKSEGVAALFD
eukprot:symbB.v1.2.016882.t2/scaffold1299.1/size126157/4